MNERKLVAVIGDANLQEDSEKYCLAEKLGRTLIDHGFRVVTGGLGGVMEAASKGARSSPKYQHGDVIGILPGNNPNEANAFVDICIPTGLDLARNIIIANADAVVAIGGGAGTLSELASSWALGRLIIAYNVEGWSGKLADQRIDTRIRYPNIPDDRVYGVSSEVEVIDLLNMISQYNWRHGKIQRKESKK
jgi:uncharacterized protein (TIGR00725 family)